MGFLDKAKEAAKKAQDEAKKAGQAAKLKGEIAIKERDITERKKRFGVEFYDAVVKINPSNPISVFKEQWATHVVVEPFQRAHNSIVEKQGPRASYEKKLEALRKGKEGISNSANSAKYTAQITVIDQQIKSKKEGLGLEMFARLPASTSGLPGHVQDTLKSTKEDIALIQGKIQNKKEKLGGGPQHGAPTRKTAAPVSATQNGRGRSPVPAKKPAGTATATAVPARQPCRGQSKESSPPAKAQGNLAQQSGHSSDPVQKVRSRSKDAAGRGRSRSKSKDRAAKKDGTEPVMKGKRPGKPPVPASKTVTATPVTTTKPAVPVAATKTKTAVPATKTPTSSKNDDPVAAVLGSFGLTTGDVQSKFAKMGLVDEDYNDSSPYGNPYGTKPTATPVQATPVQAFAIGGEEEEEEELDLDPRWELQDLKFNGKTRSLKKGKTEKIRAPIRQGIREFKRNPDMYVAIYYQSEMLEWDDIEKQKYTLVHREDTVNWKPADVTPEGILNLLWYKYARCTPLPFNMFPREFRDKYTDNMTFHGRPLHSEMLKPILPGRGMGCGDIPELKLMGNVSPADIVQGSVGNCWLLSCISALAEFPGAIKKIFRKNRNIAEMPTDKPNTYTITLWDLKTWREVDIEVDERLCANPDKKKLLLGAKPAPDGSLWGPYLEKALAAHVGGWDKIEGGQPTHAFSLLTGLKNQYTIKINETTGKFKCIGQFDSTRNAWAEQCNSPHETTKKFWAMPWPEVGGGGSGEITKNELFLKMCAWDNEDFVTVAWTMGTSDSNTTNGLVDIHAYSVIESIRNAAGTNIDMVKVRNPWGKGEIDRGQFSDGGPGWNEYPEIKELIKPVSKDDGVFWMTKQEFFVYFKNMCVCGTSMTQYLED